jgi:uncharacterized protein YjeT (DUF2065 family)
MNAFELSPTVSIFLALLIAVGGLYLLRIPQAARNISQSWTELSKAQERKIDSLMKEVELLKKQHEDCESRADALERRINDLEDQLGR